MSATHPLAYHITFGTYGTRLHGDPRGTVDRTWNEPGDRIIGRNEQWRQIERSRLRFDPVVLTTDQRLFIESTIPLACDRGGWTFHTCAAQPDHVHTLLSGAADGKAIRRWLKTWLGQELSGRWPLAVDATWWAECGSVKGVWNEPYFENVWNYIHDQRTTPDPPHNEPDSVSPGSP